MGSHGSGSKSPRRWLAELCPFRIVTGRTGFGSVSLVILIVALLEVGRVSSDNGLSSSVADLDPVIGEGPTGTDTGTSRYYTDQWAVQVEGGEDAARKLAQKYGFVYVDKV